MKTTILKILRHSLNLNKTIVIESMGVKDSVILIKSSTMTSRDYESRYKGKRYFIYTT